MIFDRTKHIPRIFIKAALLFGMLYGCMTSHAQEKIVVQYGIEDGFPSNHVYSGIQAQDGYMWFCTDKGVVKFDGYKAKVFNTSNGLLYNDVWDLMQDSKGRIWLESFGPKVQYILNDEVYSVEWEGKNHVISKFFEDKYGGIWMQSYDDIFFYEEDEFKVVLKFDNVEISRKTLFLGNNNELYVLVKKKYPDETRELSKYKAVGYKKLELLKEISEGITINDHFFILNDKTYSNRNEEVYINWEGSNNKDAFIEYLIGFGIREINHYQDYIEVELTHKSVLLNKNWDLSSAMPQLDNMNTVFQSIGKDLWVTSKDKGVFLINNKGGVNSLNKEFGENHIIGKIFLDEQNSLWLFNEKDYLFYNINNDGIIRRFEIINKALKNFKLIGLVFEDEKMYIGFEGFLCSLEINKIKNATINKIRVNEILKRTPLKDIEFFKRKQKLIFTHKFEIDDLEEIDDFYFHKKRYSSTTLAPLKDAILAGGPQGLYIVNGDDYRKFNHPKLSTKPTSYLESTPSEKHAWVATSDNQLFYVNERYEVLDSIQIKEDINSIYPENETQLWLATNKGVIGLDVRSKEKKRWFTKYDGLQSDQIVDVVANDGKLYALNPEGLDIIELEYFKDTFPDLDKGFDLFEMRVNGEQLDSLTDYVFAYNENNLQLYFPSLDFSTNQYIEYFYRLLPNESWTSTKMPEVTFESLAAGEYTFEYKYVMPNRGESEVRAIPFEIRPHFTRQLWFILLGLVLLGLSVSYYINYRLNKAKEKAEVQQKLQKKFMELELQALQSQMNPHFIFNALGTMQHFITEENTEKAEGYLTEFASLLRAYLEASREKFIPLEEELDLLKYYVSLEQMRIEGKFEFDMVIDEAVDLDEWEIPSFLVQPFIENAILHGLIPKEGKGLLLLKVIEVKEDQLIIVIEDNGVGRTNSSNVSKNKTIPSRGMEIVKERMAAINRIETQSVQFKIIDKEVGTGTIVEITISKKEE